MSSRQESIKSIFDELLKTKGSASQRVHKRIDLTAPIKIHAACVFPNKNLMLEIGPIKNAWLPQGFKKPRIKGISVALKLLEKTPESDVVLLLELQQIEAIDVFSVFVTRVCEELDFISKPELAVKAVIALIEKWKEFFAGGSDILSDERQTGLYGELYLLHYFMISGLNLGKTIKAWTGSKKTSQDYEFGSVAVEVKSSSAVDSSRVNITNSRQLDDTGLIHLFLSRVLLDARQGEEQTLPVLIDTLRMNIQKSSPEASLDFEEKLLAAGYQDKHKEQYSNRTYSERELVFYMVIDGFPRILVQNLPEGITKVSYEIALDACQEFKIDNEKVIEAVRLCCD
ncbi:MAG: PD-(D/E)XK motif protein [Woeseiaceae bacterium]